MKTKRYLFRSALRLSLAFTLISLCGVSFSAPSFAQTAVKHLSLEGAWQFRQTAPDPVAAARIGSHPETVSWHSATVPGVVQTDLLANHLIPPPFYGDNEAKLQWIGFASWEYQRTFNISASELRQQHADLVFKGLDTFATVYVNDQQVLSTDNMFRTWRIDIRPALHSGANTIRVEFQSPLTAILSGVKAREYNLPATAFKGTKPFGVFTLNYTRKAPYNYGWDWGPRFITSGIWRSAEIEFWSGARIDSVFIRQLYVGKDAANLNVDVDVVADASNEVRIEVAEDGWTPPASDFAGSGRNPSRNPDPRTATLHQTVHLHHGENHVVFEIYLPHPALWYPIGYGAQNMYRFRVRLQSDGHAIDSREAHTGLRSVELRRKPDKWGRSFAFVVNGIPIFGKGANLIPFDSFPPRTTDAQMRRVLDSAVDANMNMLRVWGGGYYETNRFYRLADERGLMLWQEFEFGDALYPNDKAFLDNVRQEAIDQVRRLRNHPSIVLWCGNNEIETQWTESGYIQDFKRTLTPEERDQVWGGYMRLFSGVLPLVVEKYSPETPYSPSSPSANFSEIPWSDINNQYGDEHYWKVWHGGLPFSAYEDQTPRFMSEYGFQSLPAMATVDSFAAPAEQSLLSPVMKAHQKNVKGSQPILQYMQREFPNPKDFASFVYVSQILQAEGIKLGAEHFRRNRPHVMGSLYWQLNDCWPGLSWSSIDYYGRWKALQYYARRFYQPVLVSPHLRNGKVEVSVISDRTTALRGAVRLELLDFAGRILSVQTVPVTIAPLSAMQVWSRPQKEYLDGADPGAVFLHSELRIQGENSNQPLSANNLYFLPYKDLHLPAVIVHSEWMTVDGRPAVRLTSPMLARDVYIETGKIIAEPSDNFFDLLAGESKTVVFRKGNAAALRQNFHVVSLTDAFSSDASSPAKPDSHH